MALDDTGFGYVMSLPGIFKIVTIICSVCAFVCAMVFDASWKIETVAFFNVMQLIILIYGIAVLVIRLANILNVTWWKFDAILSVLLACLEFGATSIWAPQVESIRNVAALIPDGSPVKLDADAFTAMVVFGYMTGIMCIVNVTYIILKV